MLDASAQKELVIGYIEEVNAVGATCRLDDLAVRKADAGSIGSRLKLKLDELWLLGEIRELKQIRDLRGAGVVAVLEFIGETSVADDGGLTRFRQGVSAYPRPGAPVCAVSEDDLKRAFADDDRGSIRIGSIHPTESVDAMLYVDRFLSRHFAIFGSSGTGKSTLVSLILNGIARRAPEGHIVVIDPHGEYATSFSESAVLLDVQNLSLPYWLMNLEEHCEFFAARGADREIDKDIIAKCLLAARAKNPLSRSISNLHVDTPLPYFLGDLISAIDEQLGRLEKYAEARFYIRLKQKVAQVVTDRRFRFVFDESLYAAPLDYVISTLLRLPANGRPISVVDLSNAPSEVVDAVVAVLARLIFNFGIWSREGKVRPVLLVCEEAQNYLPGGEASKSAAASSILERIAKEGRKHGVALGLVTQRPSDLSPAALSQCGTLISMRLNNLRDQDCLKNALPEAGKHLVSSIQGLRNQECVISGEGVPAPVRVRVANVELSRLPNSHDPSFITAWGKAGGEEELVQGTIDRWLNQTV
ncbi:ATP-binding protein [Methylocystis sp. JAN1]|uniref:ATP-binding protein n=1 Tax=Methylocystis sp. JAN1 TaxID=3397211 RepID=UPI003FA1C07F